MKASIFFAMINSFIGNGRNARNCESALIETLSTERPLWRHVVARAEFIFAFNAFPLCQTEPDSPNDLAIARTFSLP